MPSFDSITLAHVLAFITTVLVVYTLADFLLAFRGPEHRRVQHRLEDDLGFKNREDEQKQALVRDLDRESRWAIARWLISNNRGLNFRKLCYQAALPWPAYQVLAGLGFVVIVTLLLGLLLNWRLTSVLLAVLLTVGVPLIWITMRRSQRMKKFNNQLPEMLELLSQCLRAGHSLQSGFQLIAEQMPDPVGTEFVRVHAEEGLGVRLEDALDHLAERIDVLDLRMFITAVHIQRQTGGDLTELMDKLSSVIRDRIKILGQVRALTAEGQLSGWVLVALPVLVLLALFQVNDDYAKQLIGTDTGRSLLYMAAVMQVIGMILIRRIVNIQV